MHTRNGTYVEQQLDGGARSITIGIADCVKSDISLEFIRRQTGYSKPRYFTICASATWVVIHGAVA